MGTFRAGGWDSKNLLAATPQQPPLPEFCQQIFRTPPFSSMTARVSPSDGQPPVFDDLDDPVWESDFVDRLLDTVDVLVVVLDTDRQIVLFNRKCEEVTGYSAAEAEGEDLIDLVIPPEEREQVREVFADLSEGNAPLSHENHWLTKEGERRCIRWSNTVLRDEEGEVARVVGTGIDVAVRRRLEREVVTASDEERRRIGEELHDMLAPNLAGTAMMVETLARKLEEETPEVASEIQTAAERIREAGEQVRSLSHSLVPPALQDGDLPSGLQNLAERQEQMRTFTCSFEMEGTVPPLSEETASHLYHIASEAVANAAQHANPSTIAIRLEASDEHLALTVRDDGTGFPKVNASGEGIGLHLMETRADLIGATLDVAPAEGGETLVRCRLPLETLSEASE